MNPADIFGGHAKLNGYDPHGFVSCLTAGCQEHFRYLSDGRVVPEHSLSNSQKQNAQYTIDLLNLNCEYLKNKRKTQIKELTNDIRNTPSDGIEYLADMELGTTEITDKTTGIAYKKLRQFHSAILQLFGALGRRIIKECYPDLL